MNEKLKEAADEMLAKMKMKAEGDGGVTISPALAEEIRQAMYNRYAPKKTWWMRLAEWWRDTTWRHLAMRHKRDRDRAEKQYNELLPELKRRDFDEYDISRMAAMGLPTRGVIYASTLLNAYKEALEIVELSRRYAEQDYDIRWRLAFYDRHKEENR